MSTDKNNIQGYNAKWVASKTWEQFKAIADEESEANKKANPAVHFGEWGDQRDAKLKEVWDASKAAFPDEPASSTPAKVELPAKAEKPKEQKA